MKHHASAHGRSAESLAALVGACLVFLAACEPPAQPPVTPVPEPATPVPHTVEAATPPPPPAAAQLGDAPRLKEDVR